MKFSRESRASSPDMCAGQIDWDYDRAEIIADGTVHAIGVCLGLIGAVTIVVLNRSHQRARDVVAELGVGRAAEMPGIVDAMATADVVVTSASDGA